MTSREKNELLQTLLADLGKNYDPNAALNFLRILEGENKEKPPGTAIAKKNLKALLENPPKEDTTLHIIYKTPYVLGEIVLAGKKTSQDHPLCQFYPIHFKKTYLKEISRWETSPAHEAKQSHKIWQHFQESITQNQDESKPTIPLPLGGSPNTYRSQLLEAKSLGSMSPVNSNATPQEICKQIAVSRKNLNSIESLWAGIESLNQKVATLHKGGFLHNDLHKENLLIRETEGKLEGCLIDFETSEEDPRFDTLDWEQATKNDKRHLLKEACLILLCAPQLEQKKILSTSPLNKEITQMLKTDPLLIHIQREIGSSIKPMLEEDTLNSNSKRKNKPKDSPTEITNDR
jgi:hypothetical protein